MKIKDIALSAAYVGQMVVKAICVGAQEVWSAVKYIVFADPVVAQICATNFGDGTGLTEEDAAKVTDLGTVFSGSEITSFNELEKFGVKTIERYAFQDCANLTEIDLSNIEEIKGEAFKNSGLTGDLALPNLKKIDNSNYQVSHFANTKIKRITDLGSITYLGCYFTSPMFSGCTELEEVYLPDTIRYFGGTKAGGQNMGSIFTNCKSLKKVTNLDKVEELDGEVFSGCSALEIDFYNDKITALKGAFSSSGIKSFVAPNIETFSREEFKSCVNLRGDMNFPKLKTENLNERFLYKAGIDRISNLGSIKGFRDGWADVGACSQCYNLKEVILPETLEKLGINNFRDCKNLETFVCHAVIPPTYGSNAFTGTPSTMSIYVPDQSVTAYREASGWSAYASQIKPLSEYVEQ